MKHHMSFPLRGPRLTAALLLLLALIVLLCACGSNSIQFKGQGTPVPSFNPGSYVYALAQQAESYRRRNPSSNNYCVIAIYITRPGAITAGPNHVFSGFGQDSNQNHCEQVALRWVLFTAFPRQVFPGKLTGVLEINLLLFSQVRVCNPCQQSFPVWKQQLQQQVRQQPGGNAVLLGLYTWEITVGSPSGFAPGDYPAGPYEPGPPKPGTRKPVSVRRQDLNQVYP
jgi:hypothetical protein